MKKQLESFGKQRGGQSKKKTSVTAARPITHEIESEHIATLDKICMEAAREGCVVLMERTDVGIGLRFVKRVP